MFIHFFGVGTCWNMTLYKNEAFLSIGGGWILIPEINNATIRVYVNLLKDIWHLAPEWISPNHQLDVQHPYKMSRMKMITLYILMAIDSYKWDYFMIYNIIIIIILYIYVTLLVRVMIITVSWAITAWSILTHTLSNRTIITVRLKSSHCWSTINCLSPLQASRAMLQFNQANKVFHCPLFPWLAYLPSSKLT